MPLLEIVPAPGADARLVERTLEYWKGMDRVPVVLAKECTGFVANRLAFALFREAVHLVREGVISAQELDELVENSMGPRWAVAGPFKSYHFGGGAAGIEGFMKNVGGTVQACWDDLGAVDVGGGWEAAVYDQIKAAYGDVKEKDLRERDEITKEVLDARKRALKIIDG
jgi:3-hydroxyacyl-CoA dehydrogenase